MSAFGFAVTPNEVGLRSLHAQLECWKARYQMMVMKILTDFKRLTLTGIVLMVFVAGGYGSARAESTQQDTAIVAQSEAKTATDEKKIPSPESEEPGIQTDKEQESTAAEKKPLKDFQPSEKIEAEQAVDFPYDI